MSSNEEIQRYERSKLPARRAIDVPPIPVSRVSEHLEEDAAYRAEFRMSKAPVMGRRLIRGIRELHDEITDTAGGDPVLEGLLRSVEATIVMGGRDAISKYLERE